MFCTKCGKIIPDSGDFCPNCGAGSKPAFPPSAEAKPTSPLPVETKKTSDDPFVGLVIDEKYRIESKIGAGGMATVYRATRLMIGDTVAVKILHAEQVRDPKSAERFRREAQAAARLKHPNAVTIYDFGVSSDGLIYLVMELVEGQSLRTIIKEQGPFMPSAAADIMNQVCAALEEAHRQNIVHRDVKPDNIIFNITSSGLRVKVLDFGIARMRDIAAVNLTQTGSVMGTPHYMSPEQCLGEELDSRSDIYSLGVVLYEMLAGIVPFNSPTSTAVIVQHVNQAPPPLRIINVSIPANVEAVVLHALAKRREDRPQSARLLAEELSAAVMGDSTLVKSFAATASGTTAGLAGSPGLAPTMQMPTPTWGNMPTQPPVSGPLQPAPIRRIKPWMWICTAALAAILVGGGFFMFLRWDKGDHVTGGGSAQVASDAKPSGPPTIPPRTGGDLTPSPGITPPAPATPIGSGPQTGSGYPAGPQNATGPRVISGGTKLGDSAKGIPPTQKGILNIRSTPGATVLLNNKSIGLVDAQGSLYRDDLVAGKHFLTIRKDGYADENKEISLTSGQSELLTLPLGLLPGNLNINPSTPDADIEVAGQRFHDRVSALQLAPGSYKATISKRGFKAVSRSIEIGPGQTQTVEITMESLSVEDKMALIEKDYQDKDFMSVINGCQDLLANQPNQPRVNLLLGMSYFNKGNYSQSSNYLANAIDFGETVTIPIKHHHRAGLMGLEDELSNGTLTFKKGSLQYQSLERSDEDFNIPASKLYKIKPEAQKAGRVNIEVGIPKGTKEDKKTYNFHSAQARIVQAQVQNVKATRSVADCNNCEPMVELISTLLRKLK